MKRLVLLSLLLGSAVPALAQGTPSQEAKVVFRRITRIEFDSQGIDGEMKGSNCVRFGGRGRVPFKRLLPVRQNFRPEMAQSATGL